MKKDRLVGNLLAATAIFLAIAGCTVIASPLPHLDLGTVKVTPEGSDYVFELMPAIESIEGVNQCPEIYQSVEVTNTDYLEFQGLDFTTGVAACGSRIEFLVSALVDNKEQGQLYTVDLLLTLVSGKQYTASLIVDASYPDSQSDPIDLGVFITKADGVTRQNKYLPMFPFSDEGASDAWFSDASYAAAYDAGFIDTDFWGAQAQGGGFAGNGSVYLDVTATRPGVYDFDGFARTNREVRPIKIRVIVLN
jgi:hypothetical protein